MRAEEVVAEDRRNWPSCGVVPVNRKTERRVLRARKLWTRGEARAVRGRFRRRQRPTAAGRRGAGLPECPIPCAECGADDRDGVDDVRGDDSSPCARPRPLLPAPCHLHPHQIVKLVKFLINSGDGSTFIILDVVASSVDIGGRRSGWEDAEESGRRLRACQVHLRHQ